MPSPAMRRRRPSLVKGALSYREQPEWLLRRREEGWNGRFAVDGPSYMDIYSPGKLEREPRQAETHTIRGGEFDTSTGGGRERIISPHSSAPTTTSMASVGGSSTRVRVEAGGAVGGNRTTKKRVRVRTNLAGAPDQPSSNMMERATRYDTRITPPAQPRSNQPWGEKCGATLPPYPTGSTTGNSNTTTPAMPPSDTPTKGRMDDLSGKGNGAVTTESRRGSVCNPRDSTGKGRKQTESSEVSKESAKHAATAACMYREQLLSGLADLVDQWPFNEPPTSKRNAGSNSNMKNDSPKPSPSKFSSPKAPPLSYANRGKTKSSSKKKSKARNGAGGRAVKGDGSEADRKPGLRRSGSDLGKALLRKMSSGTRIGSKRHAMKVGGGPGGRSANDDGTARSMADMTAILERRPMAARSLTYFARELREAGLRCVEKVVAWSLVISPEAGRPMPFMWNNEDYLVKMHTDLDFVTAALGKDAPDFGKGNPLLLTRSEATARAKGHLAKINAATYVILDAVTRQREAENRRLILGTPKSEKEGQNPSDNSDDRGHEGQEENYVESEPPDEIDVARRGNDDAVEGGKRRGVRDDNNDTQRGRKGPDADDQDQQSAHKRRRSRPSARSEAYDGPEASDETVERRAAFGHQIMDDAKSLVSEVEDDLSFSGARHTGLKGRGGDACSPLLSDTSTAVVSATAVRSDGVENDLNSRGTISSKEYEEDNDNVYEEDQLNARAAKNDDASDGYGESFEEYEDDNDEDKEIREVVEDTDRMEQGDISGDRKTNRGSFENVYEEIRDGDRGYRDSDPREDQNTWDGASDRGNQSNDGRDTRHAERSRREAQEVLEDNQYDQNISDKTTDKVVVGKVRRSSKDSDNATIDEDDQLGKGRARQGSEELPEEQRRHDLVTKRDDHDEFQEGGHQRLPEATPAKDTRRAQAPDDVPRRIGAYDVEGLLGDGAYGWVYRCTKTCGIGGIVEGSKDVVAIKEFKGVGETEDEHTRKYVRLTQEREAELVQSLLHPNIVRCLGTLPSDASAYGQTRDSTVGFLIFEHIPGTLLDLIQGTPGGLSLEEVPSLLAQLLLAVSFLHESDVVHRDIKPENILVDQRQPGAAVLKLCDLGTARKANEIEDPPLTMREGSVGSDVDTRRWTDYVGSRWYRAPEMLAGSIDYGTGVDVWACACLAVEMRSGRPLFPGEDEGELAMNMASLLGPLPPSIAKRLRDVGFETPPPRGVPTRTLEGCLDGSTGSREVPKGGRRGKAEHEQGGACDGNTEMQELLQGMLIVDPLLRLSAKDCLRTPFFSVYADSCEGRGEETTAADDDTIKPGVVEAIRAGSAGHSHRHPPSSQKLPGTTKTPSVDTRRTEEQIQDGDTLPSNNPTHYSRTSDLRSQHRRQEEEAVAAASAAGGGIERIEDRQPLKPVPADRSSGPSPDEEDARDKAVVGERGFVLKRVAEIERKEKELNAKNAKPSGSPPSHQRDKEAFPLATGAAAAAMGPLTDAMSGEPQDGHESIESGGYEDDGFDEEEDGSVPGDPAVVTQQSRSRFIPGPEESVKVQDPSEYFERDGPKCQEASEVLATAGPGGEFARQALELLLQTETSAATIQAAIDLLARAVGQGDQGCLSRKLAKFGALVGGSDGLAPKRLVTLTAGLARCADEGLRNATQKCQAWAIQARQGKGRGGTRGESAGPLSECAEYLGSHVSNLSQARLASGRARPEGVADACASALIAISHAADEGREAAIADVVHASASLETLSRTVCSLAPFILDVDRPKRDRDQQLAAILTAVGLGFTGNEASPASAALIRSAMGYLLSPAGQAVLLRATLTEGGERRVNLVTSRENALQEIETMLEEELTLVDKRLSGSEMEPLSKSAPALVLNPYYLSEWGKKRILGKRVEEGEGFGPRKELFELAASQLSERWKGVMSTPGDVKAKATAREGRAEVEITFSARTNASLLSLADGWKLKVGEQSQILTGVKSERVCNSRGGGVENGTVRVTGRVERMWDKGFQSEEADFWTPCSPVLIYHKGSEMSWLDAKASCKDADHRRRLRTLGALLALAATNACRLPVELPDIFFRWMLLGESGFEPSVEDLVALDPALESSFDSLREAVLPSRTPVESVTAKSNAGQKLRELLEVEALPLNTSPGAYISYMVRQTFLEPLEWQISEIRAAFLRAVPQIILGGGTRKASTNLRRRRPSSSDSEGSRGVTLPRPSTFAEIVRGPLGTTEYDRGGVRGPELGRQNMRDFDFREAFTVHEDRDLLACPPLHEAFWAVVQSDLSSQERRSLLLFITGTDRLPEAGCEILSIEVPFQPSSGGRTSATACREAAQALGTVPTAHTCDSVLELPNYWTLLLASEGLSTNSDLSAANRERLTSKLKSNVAGRLRVALSNATGYALDDLDDSLSSHSASEPGVAERSEGVATLRVTSAEARQNSATDAVSTETGRHSANAQGHGPRFSDSGEDFPDIPSISDAPAQDGAVNHTANAGIGDEYRVASAKQGIRIETQATRGGDMGNSGNDSDDDDFAGFLAREKAQRRASSKSVRSVQNEPHSPTAESTRTVEDSPMQFTSAGSRAYGMSVVHDANEMDQSAATNKAPPPVTSFASTRRLDSKRSGSSSNRNGGDKTSLEPELVGSQGYGDPNKSTEDFTHQQCGRTNNERTNAIDISWGGIDVRRASYRRDESGDRNGVVDVSTNEKNDSRDFSENGFDVELDDLEELAV